MSVLLGNVGIGITTNPTAKLHIGGVAGVDGIRFPDGTKQTTAPVVTSLHGWLFSNDVFLDDGENVIQTSDE
ncbi:MAG: hypothetical protein LRZ98_01090 [Candidatus Pacebacteria bacterium]|nr:hypothetical protein [Candidatus Paceibacterota bacterium]